MRRKRVESSSLASVGYSRRTRILEEEFNTGRVYRYSDVSAEVCQALLDAESKGRFFNTHIKRQYPYEEIGHRYL